MTTVQSNDSDGRYEVFEPAFDRRQAMHIFEALPPAHPMLALLEFDVTVPLERIEAMRRRGVRVSLFAFVVHAIAVAISEHPDLNLLPHGRKLVRFEDVDVSVPVEVKTAKGRFPRELVLRRVQHRSPAELYAEIEDARGSHRSHGKLSARDRWSRRQMSMLRFVPGFVRRGVLRRYMNNAFLMKRRGGTTLVTSVGKYASIPGFACSLITGPRAAAFAVGGTVEKPWIHQGEVARRTVLPISIVLNHDLLDGAPAARFAMRLREILDSCKGLDAPHVVATATPAE